MGSAPAASARRVLTDSIGGGSQVSTIVRSDACPCCGPVGGDVELIHWKAGEPLAVGAPAAESLQLRLPEAIVFGARCEACGADASAAIPVGTRVRGYTTDARICARCGDESVAIDGRDAATLAELLRALGGRAPALPYFWVEDPRIALCVEIDE
jgi:hypothetical protein